MTWSRCHRFRLAQVIPGRNLFSRCSMSSSQEHPSIFLVADVLAYPLRRRNWPTRERQHVVIENNGSLRRFLATADASLALFFALCRAARARCLSGFCALYALCSAIIEKYENTNQAKNIFVYSKSLPVEFAVMLIKDSLKSYLKSLGLKVRKNLNLVFTMTVLN